MSMKKKWILCISIVIFVLFLSSCKERGIDTEITTESEAVGSSFDTALEDITSATTAEETTKTEKEATEDEETEETNDDETEDYAAPSCGDSICTYYETFSSCPADCEKLEETTLADYPAFLEDGTLLVVGDEASSTDVITATLINVYLVSQDISAETKLASEVSDFTSTDLILVGSPCDNKAIATLLHYTSETCKDIITEQNNAVIKLLVSDTNEIIIITGYDKDDTKIASKMLTDTTAAYNLNGAEEWINLANDDINLYFSKN